MIDEIVLTGTDVDVDGVEYSTFITVNNVWNGTTSRKCGIYAIPDGTVKVKITANAENNTGVAFLKTNTHTNNTAPNYASGWTKTESVTVNTSKEFFVPDDAAYFYFTKKI